MAWSGRTTNMRLTDPLIILGLFVFVLGGCARNGLDFQADGGPKDLSVFEVKVNDQAIDPAWLEKVQELFNRNRLKLDDLIPKEVEADDLGYTHARFDQTVNHLRVFHQEVIYHFDQNGQLSSVSGRRLEPSANSAAPTLTKEAAAQIAAAEMQTMAGKEQLRQLTLQELNAELGYYHQSAGDEEAADLVLTWKIEPKSQRYPLIFVNAETGSIVDSDSGIRY